MQFDEWMAAKPYLSFKQVFWSHFTVLYHHSSISQLLYCMHCDIACSGFNHSLWIISFSSCSVSRPSPSTATFFVPSDALGVSSSERRQRRGWEASLKSGSTRQMRCVQYMLPLNHTDVPTVTSQVSRPVFIIYSRSLYFTRSYSCNWESQSLK